jgi:hypothetical protein
MKEEVWARRVDFRRWEGCSCSAIILVCVQLGLGDPLTVFSWGCRSCDSTLKNVWDLGKAAG